MTEEPLSDLCQKLYHYMACLDGEGLHFERKEALEALAPVQTLERALDEFAKTKELLKALVARNPLIPSEVDGDLSCFWCGAFEAEKHDPGCLYLEAYRLLQGT